MRPVMHAEIQPIAKNGKQGVNRLWSISYEYLSSKLCRNKSV